MLILGAVNESMDLMKDYMASGSFSRGKDQVQADASMVFIGNINDSVDTLVKTSHLFQPLPEKMIDCAFLDRFHSYLPGWEIPKFRPKHFTDQYGFIVDYLAEWFREMRKRNYSDAIDKFFKLGKDLNQRDTIAVKHTVSGFLKLLYPHEQYTKEDVEECLVYALEARDPEQLDRLSRSLKDLLFILEKLQGLGVGFKSLTESVDTTTPAGRMMAQMIGAFAEFEREMVRERTRSGLEAARKEGRVGGRKPKLTQAQVREAKDMVGSGRKTKSEVAKLFGVHPSTISRVVGANGGVA